VFGLIRSWRRKRLLRTPVPEQWRAIVQRNVPLFSKLGAPQQKKVLDSTRILLAEKHFEGCGGLELTEEMRVTIAAHASLLLLGRASDYFPNLDTILVYPSAYRGKVLQQVAQGIVEEGDQGRLGESSSSGVVVLSWDSVVQGATDPGDGQNVALHEFAHQLDQEDGTADGTPYLGGRGFYSAWARVLGADFQKLREGTRMVLDSYGATNPAEFFAVATEAFFEKPVQMQQRNPELYQQLSAYYGVDPAAERPG
jgi:Mlc titration factor MtfA (ptsG expression regulator)